MCVCVCLCLCAWVSVYQVLNVPFSPISRGRAGQQGRRGPRLPHPDCLGQGHEEGLPGQRVVLAADQADHRSSGTKLQGQPEALVSKFINFFLFIIHEQCE